MALSAEKNDTCDSFPAEVRRSSLYPIAKIENPMASNKLPTRTAIRRVNPLSGVRSTRRDEVLLPVMDCFGEHNTSHNSSHSEEH